MMARAQPLESASIIIPNLNCPILTDSLRVLREQAARSRVRAEIIVVGQDSYGNGQLFPTVQFVETASPVWPSVARNIAIKRATGQLILCLDADCVPENGWIDRMIAAHDSLSEKRSVVGGSIRVDSDNIWALADNLASFNAYLPAQRETIRDTLPTCNVSMLRGAFGQVGYFDEHLQIGEDTDWMMRARRLGFTLRFDSGACVWHQSQRTSMDAVLSHAGLWGYHSVRNRLIYSDLIGLPSFARHWAVFLALAPATALWATSRVYTQRGTLRAYWPAVPLVALAKLAWCWGAARRLREAGLLVPR